MENDLKPIKRYESPEEAKKHYARLAFQNYAIFTKEELEEMKHESDTKMAESEAIERAKNDKDENQTTE